MTGSSNRRFRWPWPVWGFARASAGRRFAPGLSGVRCAPNPAASAPAEKASLASGMRERAALSQRGLQRAPGGMDRYTNANCAPRKMNSGRLRPCQHVRAELQLWDESEVTKSTNANCLMGDPFARQKEPSSRWLNCLPDGWLKGFTPLPFAAANCRPAGRECRGLAWRRRRVRESAQPTE